MQNEREQEINSETMANLGQGMPAPPVPSPLAPHPDEITEQPGQWVVHLNWSNFKPEFSRKPEEDAEVHLIRTNDWMDTHYFVGGVKAPKFCLTLLGKARL